MDIRVVDVTPKLAAEMLKTLAGYQRRLNVAHVQQLESDLRAGRWIPNGSPIRFDQDGACCDGQHRLHACVRSGVTLREQVVIGEISAEAYGTIDTNAHTRTALQIARSRNSIKVAPSTSTIAAAGVEQYNFDVFAYEHKSTPMERVEIWQRLPEHMQIYLKRFETASRAQTITSRGALAAALRCTREAGNQAAQFFIAAFANDVSCSTQGRVLFNTLSRGRGKQRDQARELANAWICMRAFTAYHRNERMQILRPPIEWPADQRTLASMIGRVSSVRMLEPAEQQEISSINADTQHRRFS